MPSVRQTDDVEVRAAVPLVSVVYGVRGSWNRSGDTDGLDEPGRAGVAEKGWCDLNDRLYASERRRVASSERFRKLRQWVREHDEIECWSKSYQVGKGPKRDIWVEARLDHFVITSDELFWLQREGLIRARMAMRIPFDYLWYDKVATKQKHKDIID